jgi:HEAT repeat protein
MARDTAITDLISALNTHGERLPKAAAVKLAKHGRQAIPELVRAMQTSGNVRIRRWSAYTLGLIGYPHVVPHLKRALHDPNMSVRLLAMEALADVAGPAAGSSLLPLLKDTSGGVRVRTITCLERLKVRKAARHATRSGMCGNVRPRRLAVSSHVHRPAC